jgi:lipopolysaccharide export system permease protein
MRLLNRYVLSRFGQSLLLSAAGFVTVFIVVDLSNSISAYLDKGATASAILAYYAWSVPYFLFLVLPMAMLLGSLFCIGGLARTNELSAMKAAGISLYRVLLPIQVFAVLVSCLAWSASWSFVPRANRERAELKYAAPSRLRQHRAQLVLRDREGQVVTVGEYRTDTKRGRRVTIDQYAGGELVSKIRANELIWSGDHWILVDGEHRTFDEARERVAPFDTIGAVSVTLLPVDFGRESRPVEELDTSDLEALVLRKRANGFEATRDRVELALRTAFSFSGMVMVFFGLPLSAHTRRASRPLQVGICLLISFVFYGSLQAARAMGWNGILDPVTAAWGPNAVFLVVGLIMLKRAQT